MAAKKNLNNDDQPVRLEEARDPILGGRLTPEGLRCEAQNGRFEEEPEQGITDQEYERYVSATEAVMAEDVDKVHVDCANGACPADFSK